MTLTAPRAVMAIISGSPAQVVQLSPGSADAAALRRQQVEVLRRGWELLAAQSPARVDIICSHDRRWYTGHRGSFAAWGAAELNVGGGNYLGELVARYLLDCAGIKPADIRVRSRIGQVDPQALSIVVVDGSAGLDARAPLSLLPQAHNVADWCQRLCRTGQAPTAGTLSEFLSTGGIIEPALWQELAQCASAAAATGASPNVLQAQYTLIGGVGHHSALWHLPSSGRHLPSAGWHLPSAGSSLPAASRAPEAKTAAVPIAVVGPTASGKSALGLALAHHYGGEIVNVDSMQLYRGMDIGTAKLAPEEREGIAHHQLDTLEVTETASVAAYQQAAIADIDDIRRRGHRPIMVGGSMLYVQSLVDDWQFPPTDPQVRARYEQLRHELGTQGLHAYLASIDPAAAAIIEDNDPRRTVRALEVIELTGQPFQASQPPIDAPPRWNTIIIGLRTESSWLNERIERRTHQMFDTGLIAEVEQLQERGLVANSTAGRAIGYAQVLDALAGELSWEQAVERTIFGTRRYVRRQRAWFNRDQRIHWISAEGDTFAQAREIIDALDTRSELPGPVQ